MLSKRDARNNSQPYSEFAYLGLHQAALSGNVGLVQYALSQGQPVDAARDGISALHAAAAGGSEHVARLLIEHGADPSFGRTEREMKARTSSSSSSTPAMEKSTDPLSKSPREPKPRSLSSSSLSAPDALLTPGSTPLHFACAHNHPAVARVLLHAGAAPHIRDKAGVTPLDLLPPSSSSSSDSSPLRQAIREYYEAAKAREKEERGAGVFFGKAAAVLGAGDGMAGRKSTENLRGKKSTEALRGKKSTEFRSPKHVPAPLPSLSPRHNSHSSGTPPPSPRRLTPSRTPPSSPSRFTFGSATTPPSFATAGASSSTPPLPPLPSPTLPPLEHRRPSLPHLFPPPPSPPLPHTPSPPPHPTPPSARRPLHGSSRPRSAGSGSGAPAFGTGVTAPNPRPRTKRSLLSLFKRGDADECEDKDKEGEKCDEKRDLEGEWARDREKLVAGALPPPPLHDAVLGRGDQTVSAPPGRTTFDEDEDGEEEYGVVLTRTPDILAAQDLPSSDDDDGSHYSDAEHEDLEGEDEYEDSDEETTGHFVPPQHAEAWYRDRVESAPPAAPRFRRKITDSPGPSTATSFPPSPAPAPPFPPSPAPIPTRIPSSDAPTPSPRPGILRTDNSHRAVRPTASRGALRFDARVRGDSVSSASTNTDAPRSPTMVGAGSLGTAATSVSVPGSFGEVEKYAGADKEADLLREKYADPLLRTDTDQDDDDDRDTALGLSLRTVSNHAQAEALVQKAAKEILAMEMEQAPGMSLSAQLAAFGEKVQLERRFAKGEAQRWKSPVKTRFNGEEVGGGEEERRRERMVRSQREMDRYASAREKEKEGKERERKALDVIMYGGEAAQKSSREGVPLERTASLEKELEPRAPRRPRAQKMRRPHTSDSVASGNAPPPRFGHSTTHSSSSVLRGPGDDPLRGFVRERRAPHHPALRSASAHPRAESLDQPRAPVPPTPVADNDDSGSLRGGSSSFLPPALAFDEFGASTSSIRPPTKQRFGGLRSLFGKGKQ